MGNFSPLEIGIIAVMILLLFGAKRLPELARSCGESIREFKKSLSGSEKDDTSGSRTPPVE